MKKLMKLMAILLVVLMAMPGTATAKTNKKNHKSHKQYSQTLNSNVARAAQSQVQLDLEIAISEADEQAVKDALARGADANKVIAKTINVKILDVLLTYGTNVDITTVDEDGRTVLHNAVENQNLKCVMYIVQHFPHDSDIFALMDYHGDTAISLADKWVETYSTADEDSGLNPAFLEDAQAIRRYFKDVLGR